MNTMMRSLSSFARLLILPVLLFGAAALSPVTEAANLKVLEVCNYTVTNCTASGNYYSNRAVVAPGQVLEYKFFYSGDTPDYLQFTLPAGMTYLQTTTGTAPTNASAGDSTLTYDMNATGTTTVFGTFRVQVAGGNGTFSDNFMAFFPASGAGIPAEASGNVEILVTTNPTPISARTLDGNHNGSIDAYELLFVNNIQDSTFNATGLQIGNQAVTPITVCPAVFAADAACQTADDNRVIIGFQDNVYTNTQVKPDIIDNGGLFSNVPAIASDDLQELDGANPVAITVFPLTITSNNTIDILYSESMNPATLTNAAITFTPNIAFTAASAGGSHTTLRVTPNNPSVFTNPSYLIDITAAATDFAGNPVIADTGNILIVSDVSGLQPAPTITVETTTNSSIQLNWTPVAGAVSYIATLRDVAGQRDFTMVVTGTTATFTNLPAGATFEARVVAVNGSNIPVSAVGGPLSVSTQANSGNGGGGNGGGGGGGGGGGLPGSGSYGGLECPYGLNNTPYNMPGTLSSLTSQIKDSVLLPGQGSTLGTFTRNLVLINCANSALKAEISQGTVLQINGAPTSTVLRAPYVIQASKLTNGINFPSNLASSSVIMFGTLKETFTKPVTLSFTIPSQVLANSSSNTLALRTWNSRSNSWENSPIDLTGATATSSFTLSTDHATILAFVDTARPDTDNGGNNNGGSTSGRPENLDVSFVDGYVLLSWTDPQGDVASIELFRKTKGTEYAGTPTATIEGGVGFYFDGGTSPYTEYSYRLRAVYTDGSTSPWSEEISIIVDETGTIIYECIPSIPFTDTLNHWGASYIETLRLRCIVSGKTPGIFAPNTPITRAELTKLVIHAYGHAYKLEDNITRRPFPDVALDAWYPGYITLALEEGIIDGYPDGNFRPNQLVNRAEALKMIINASGEAYNQNALNDLFMDTPAGAWYIAFTTYAQQQGIIEGYPNTSGGRDFKPAQNITRAEAAKIIALLLNR